MFKPILSTLTRPYMDLAITSRRDFDIHIYERPGRWMERDALDRLSQELRDVASKTLASGALNYGVFSGDAERMGDVIVTLVRAKDGAPIAFNALAVMELKHAGEPEEVLHLGLVMVDPDATKQRLSWVLYGLTCFLIFVRKQFRPIWVSNVTQVPAFVGMVSETFSDVFPRPAKGRWSLTHLLLGRQIMTEHRHVFRVGEDAGFDEDRFVITNAYTGGSDDLKKTFDEAAKHRSPTYNFYCQEMLDYQRGDDLIQLGRMDFVAVRGYLRDMVPSGAVVSLIFAATMVAVQRLILPVVHWADTSKTWGSLRPSKEARK
ncbi:MAG: hypothetical protein P8M63_14835 [Paracoccaceae bacterium]|jgi:hypothetical protein|nr:hypothetical protein [Paracoccaceae bacterium]